MNTSDMLDEITNAVERLLKASTRASPRPTRRMTRAEFVTHALSELQKAATEPRGRALERLSALGRTVEVAKQAFADHESESVQVPIFVEDTTALSELSETEVSPLAVSGPGANATFASNPDDLHKVLDGLKKRFEELRRDTRAAAASAPPSNGRWPLDMNTDAFRSDVRKTNDGPTWGYDPGFPEATHGGAK